MMHQVRRRGTVYLIHDELSKLSPEFCPPNSQSPLMVIKAL